MTSGDVLATARALATDRAAAEVVTEFRSRGVDCILLKGRTLARLLYDDGAARPYVDIDVLVAPDAHGRAEEAARALGFTRALGDEDMASGAELHAHPWARHDDSARLDLHRTIRGLTASHARVWETLRGRAVASRVGGAALLVPDLATCAMHVAVHAADRGLERGKPVEDLRRALARLDEPTWAEAAVLARELEAEDAFDAGLRLLPEGVALAGRLGVRGGRSVHVLLSSSGAPELAHGLEQLAGTPGIGPKLRALGRAAVPTRGALRASSRLARRGRLGLAAAYLAHPLGLAARTPATLLAWRRARRAVR